MDQFKESGRESKCRRTADGEDQTAQPDNDFALLGGEPSMRFDIYVKNNYEIGQLTRVWATTVII